MPHKDLELRRAYMKEWRSRNGDKLSGYARRHYLKHREKMKVQRRAYYERTKSQVRAQSKAWLERNFERYIAWLAEYRKRPEVIARNRAKFHAKKKNNPSFALSLTLRCRIRRAIKAQSGVKAKKSFDLLGCSIEHARKHIEAQFEPGMGWENYGRNGWHLDHVVPCSSFDLRNPKHQQRCFHYSNLRPVWERDNILKGSMVAGELPLRYRLPSC